MKNPAIPPPQSTTTSPRMPRTHSHAFDDFFFGCMEYAPASWVVSQLVLIPAPGDGLVVRGWFITTVGAASGDVNVRTEPSSRQKFRPSSSYVLRQVGQIFIWANPLNVVTRF